MQKHIFKTADINVCPDCLSWIVNGDATSLDYYYSPDQAAAILEKIQEGERLLMERYGGLHATTSHSELSTGGCDCCGRFERQSMPLTMVCAYVSPEGEKIGDRGSRYLDARFILDAEVNELWWQKQGLSYTATGYGRKIPTRYTVQCADNRKRRVYCAVFGNIGSLYIVYKGRDLVLDVDGRTKLEKARDAA